MHGDANGGVAFHACKQPAERQGLPSARAQRTQQRSSGGTGRGGERGWEEEENASKLTTGSNRAEVDRKEGLDMRGGASSKAGMAAGVGGADSDYKRPESLG